MYRQESQEYEETMTVSGGSSYGGSFTYRTTNTTTYPTDNYVIAYPTSPCYQVEPSSSSGPDGRADLDGHCPNMNTTYTCSSEIIGLSWADPTCATKYSDWYHCVNPTWNTTGSGSETPSDTVHISYGYESNNVTNVRRTQTKTIRGNEYTTSELIGRLRADITAAPYDVTGGTAACLSLESNERCGTATKVKVIVSFQTEKGVKYLLQWSQWTIYDGVGSSLSYQMNHKMSVTGTGGIVQKEIELFPPTRPGCTSVGGFTLGYDPDEDGAPPGTGGPGGITGGRGSHGDCSSCGDGPRGFSAAVFEMEMGRRSFGGSAGALTMAALESHDSLGKPSMLQFLTDDSQVIVVKSGGNIRQVNALEALADVQTINNYKFEVRYYLPSQVGTPDGQGIYALSGSPYVTWTVENPDASSTSTNKWKVSETRDGNTKAHQYEFFPSTRTWKLASPGNLREDELKVENDTVNNTRTETTWVRKPGGPDLQKVKRIYKKFTWGEALIEERVGPDADPEITTWTYTANGSANGSRVPLEKVVYPDGRWENYEHNGGSLRLSKTISQFLNSPETAGENYHRVTEYSYSAVGGGSGDDITIQPDTPRTIIHKLKGQEIGRTYKIFKTGEEWDVVCPTPGAAWNASENLTTITKRFTSGANQHRISSIKHANGTYSLYSYTDNPNDRTIHVDTGQSNDSGASVSDGTRTETTINLQGAMLSRIVTGLTGGFVGGILSSETYSEHDTFNRPEKVTFLDGTFERTDYDTCCGLVSTTDRDGNVTEYFYDDMRRVIATRAFGILTSNLVDAAGRRVVSKRRGTDGNVLNLKQFEYDLASHVIKETNALGGITTHTEGTEGGFPIKTTTYADGGVHKETYFLDGQVQKVTGTATHPVRYDHGIEFEGGQFRAYSTEFKLDSSGADSGAWTKTYFDGAGRNYKTIYYSASSPAPTTQSVYNNKNQLLRQIDQDGVSTVFEYNGKGEQEYVVQDMNRNGVKDLTTAGAADDRITKTVRDLSLRDGFDTMWSATYVWTTEDNGTANTLVSETELAANGLRTWNTTHNGGSSITRRTEVQIPTAANSWTRTVTQFEPDNSKSVSVSQTGRLASVTRRDSADVQIGQTLYSYDAHGRQSKITDARNGTTTYAFNNADQVTSVTTPSPGNGQGPQITLTHYNNMLQATNVTYADGTSVTNFYTLRGELQRTIGSRTYPVGYTYDSQGRMTHMTNWSSYPSGGPRVTQWNYHQYRGWLTSKRYPDPATGLPSGAGSVGPDYTYTSGGRLLTRTWARGTPRIQTTYAYNNMGEIESITYNDGVTPSTTYTYDRRGRQSTVTRNSITTTLGYNDANQLTAETYSGGTLNGLSVTLSRDSLLRRSGNSLGGVSGSLSVTYGYDNASRLLSVSDGTQSATYAYVANSSLVDNLVFKQSTTTRMTTRRQHDKLNRLQSISFTTNSVTAPGGSYSYVYNDANQRVRVNLVDGSHWIYQYDKLGQVVSGKRYWSDGSPVAGQQFEYGFDEIGNRSSTKVGGDSNGANLRSATYTANRLNQYSSRTVPSAIDILGAAKATASVTVNNVAPTARKSEYYHKEVSVANSSAAVWHSVSVVATEGANNTTINGNLFVPRTPENYTFDLDGNQTTDGRWTYTWDAENRLTRMVANTAIGPQQRVDFEYDWKGRRISKKVWNNTAGTGTPAVDQRLLYDGWNLLAIVDNANAATHSFTWGTDLSGSLQGSGGVGGLLSIKIHSGPNAGTYFDAYDGNGNVIALVNAANGAIVATYEYSPFGDLIRATGPLANANPFRFSTKFHDGETDFLYYGYRYYNPNTGRWLSRDPIEERGGANFYCFVHNNALDDVDAFGLMRFREIVKLMDELNAHGPQACCCMESGRAEVKPILSGTAGGRWVMMTVKTKIQGACPDLTKVIQYYWWDCFTAQREYDADPDPNKPQGPDQWQEYGWRKGGTTDGRDETGEPPGPDDTNDANHWNWRVAVLYSYCAPDNKYRVKIAESNEFEWTWDDKKKSWGDPQERH
jgi:RHS repeat-associated protein